MNKNVLVVAGPTASGKTSLSVQLAKALNGEIISADSMQIYKDMNIGSAKPDQKEREGIAHHMMDVVEPSQAFSVAEYVVLAKQHIEDILSRNKCPVVVGGTGLFITSLVDNVQFAEGKADHDFRRTLYQLGEEKGKEYLHDRLKEIDPEAAEWIHPNNLKRVVRAIEFYHTTGVTLTEQKKLSKSVPSPYQFCMMALNTDREVLYERINRRVQIMMDLGLIEEVKRLKEMGCHKEMQSMQGIGYQEVLEYLDGNITEDQCIELIRKNTRNYAKRQLTWFQRDKRYYWLEAMEENLAEKALSYWRDWING